MSKLDQIKNLGAIKRAERARPNPFEDAARGRDPQPNPVAKEPKAGGHNRPVMNPSGPGHRGSSRVRAGRTVQDSPQASPPAAVAIQKRGRGRPKVTGKRPWEIEGVSKRTYYRRRQKEAKQ